MIFRFLGGPGKGQQITMILNWRALRARPWKYWNYEYCIVIHFLFKAGGAIK